MVSSRRNRSGRVLAVGLGALVLAGVVLVVGIARGWWRVGFSPQALAAVDERWRELEALAALPAESPERGVLLRGLQERWRFVRDSPDEAERAAGEELLLAEFGGWLEGGRPALPVPPVGAGDRLSLALRAVPAAETPERIRGLLELARAMRTEGSLVDLRGAIALADATLERAVELGIPGAELCALRPDPADLCGALARSRVLHHRALGGGLEDVAAPGLRNDGFAEPALREALAAQPLELRPVASDLEAVGRSRPPAPPAPAGLRFWIATTFHHPGSMIAILRAELDLPMEPHARDLAEHLARWRALCPE